MESPENDAARTQKSASVMADYVQPPSTPNDQGGSAGEASSTPNSPAAGGGWTKGGECSSSRECAVCQTKQSRGSHSPGNLVHGYGSNGRGPWIQQDGQRVPHTVQPKNQKEVGLRRARHAQATPRGDEPVHGRTWKKGRRTVCLKVVIVELFKCSLNSKRFSFHFHYVGWLGGNYKTSRVLSGLASLRGWRQWSRAPSIESLLQWLMPILT
ncbi:hypothetical protein HDK77DRAFT_103755 [Phyllosticta capitalensis]